MSGGVYHVVSLFYVLFTIYFTNILISLQDIGFDGLYGSVGYGSNWDIDLSFLPQISGHLLVSQMA